MIGLGEWSQEQKCKVQTRQPRTTREVNKNLKTNHHKNPFQINKYLQIKKYNKNNKTKWKKLDKSKNQRMQGLAKEKYK